MKRPTRIPLQAKLFFLFFMAIIIPLSMCTLLLFRQSTTIIEQTTGSSYVARLEFFSNKLKLTVDNFYQDMLNIAVDRNIQKMLMSPITEGDASYLDYYNYLAQSTYNVFIKDNMIHSIGIYSSRHDWLFMNTRHTSRFFLEEPDSFAWVRTAKSGIDLNRPYLVDSVPTNNNHIEPVIVQYLPLWDEHAKAYYGYISINLDTEAVGNLLRRDFDRDSPRNILIVDQYGNRICDYGSGITFQELEDMSNKAEQEGASGFYTGSINGGKVFITHSYIPAYGWRVFIVTPYQNVAEQVSGITSFAVSIFLLVLLLTILIAYLLSKNLLSPLSQLFVAMRRVKEGDLGITIDYRRDDEIGLLYEGFNEMSQSLETLMQDLYQEELAKKDIQLKVMSYQINAHFLYNTLDAIHWIARINKVPKISSLVSALATYFRITLSEGKDMIALSQVIELARNYLNIYAIKSDFEVDFRVDIPEELYRYKTLKYIFQPLLENALNHGIENKAEDGVVSLACRKEGEDLLFTVYDSGAGVAPDDLAKLQAILRNSDLDANGSFALRNINKQIKLYYGERYGMAIDSVFGQYTIVTVRVPAKNPD